MANAQAVLSKRFNPPTVDTLQQCDAQQLENFKARLISQGDYSPDMALLCVEERIHNRYQALRSREAGTNCYGDAIGIADRVNPGGTFHDDLNHCDALIDGALKDGAVPAENDVCPDHTRQMQFFTTEDRRDYHVISCAPGDETWMNKFTGTPRFPVSISGAAVPQLSGGLIWIIKNDDGKVWVNSQRVKDYPIRCPEVLCSLPAKEVSPKSDL